jgi:Predicted membrane protein (DUF2207) C-terminal domain
MRGGHAWLASAGSSSDLHAIDARPAAGIVALVLAVLAGFALVALLRSRRLSPIAPAGASIELRPEPPAVVDLLTGGFEVEDDGVPATVVHLAARRWFTIEDYGDETIIRTRTLRPTNDRLQRYERRVLDHIEHHAIDTVVPTRVLTIGPEGVSDRWFRGFAKEVTDHAQQLGLCVDRWSWKHRGLAWLLVAFALAPAWIVADSSETTDETARWVTLGNILLGAAFVVAAALGVLAWRTTRRGAQRDTPAGAAAASHWLGVRDFYRNTGEFTDKSAASVAIWDQHLAYATAMGLAQKVQRQIPFETEHDRHAWSRATGQWRRVKVSYHTMRPGWGRHPAWMAVTGLFLAAVWSAVAYAAIWVANFSWRTDVDEYYTLTDRQERWISLVATTAAVFALACAAWMATRFVFGCADLFRTRTVEGELVRRRSRGGGEDSTPTYHLAIDTATATQRVDDTILAYRVRSDIYNQTAQGARVRLVLTPLLGYVKSVETLVPAPFLPSMADSSDAAEVVVTQAMESFAVGWSSLIGGLAAKLAARTNADLDPATLDTPDADGITPRQRMEDARAQITAMLQDPAVANTPTAKFLEAFLQDSARSGP